LSYKVIAEKLGVSVATVSRICIQNGLRRKRDILTEADLSKLEG
jgi:DNA-binding LacI/PurR family transcriptional regulator